MSVRQGEAEDYENCHNLIKQMYIFLKESKCSGVSPPAIQFNAKQRKK